MAAKVTIMNGQTLADIALQELGSIEALFALAQLNGLNITDDLVAGQILNTDLTPVSKSNVKAFADSANKPASWLTITGDVVILEGIGYWAIGVDFIVS